MNEWDLLAKKLQAQRSQNALAEAQNNANQNQGGGGFWEGIGSVLSGIGNSIGNVGTSLYNMFGTGAASVRDLVTGNAGTGKYQNEWKDYLKGAQYGDANMSDKDYYAKTAGNSLNAAATLSDFIPGLGKGAKVALNVGQGVASGVGNEFAQNGANASLEGALKGAAIGAAGAGVGQLVGNKLANAATTPAKGLVGKALQSNIGRGAITGAASGAAGTGLDTALNGGNLGQTLSSALQGAGQGSLAGATTSAIYGAAGKALGKVKDKIENGPKSIKTDVSNVLADQPTEKEIPEGTRRRQTAMGWDEESLSGEAKKKNYLQQLGGDLQEAAQATRDSSIYGKLKGNTAQEMINKDAINNLRSNYGYSPDDYEQASKLSTAINKWYDNEVKSSGATKTNTKLVGELALESNNTLPTKYEKAYRESINTALNMANAGESGAIDTYSASGLERAAKYLGEQEQKYRRTSMNGVDGRVDGDRSELADYYKKARQTLRSEINTMIDLDDVTKNNLSKMLDDAGATKQAKAKILNSKSFSEVKSNTAPLEDARTMYNQMRSSGLKRGANADNTTSLGTKALKAVGGDTLLDVAAKPIRTGASIVEKAVGKGIENLGNVAAGEGGLGKVAQGIQTVTKGAENGLNTGVLGQTVGDIANRQIARQTALGLAQDQDRARASAQAQENLYNAQTDYNNAATAYQNALNNQVTPAQQAATDTLSRIENAMQLALNAGDMTSYSKLADLYSTASKMYSTTTANTNPLSKLTSSQIENVNKLDTASNAIDELEALFNKAGGGQGLVGGNAANFLASLGLNSDVATYNSISRGLINQIGAAIGKTDSLNTEGEVNRALELIPKFTDDAATARNKLAQLRQMLQTNKQTVYQNYGLTQ